jgi:hypothetical protein
MWLAHTILGTFRVSRHFMSKDEWEVHHNMKRKSGFASREAAEKAAKEWFRKRMCEGLVPADDG